MIPCLCSNWARKSSLSTHKLRTIMLGLWWVTSQQEDRGFQEWSDTFQNRCIWDRRLHASPRKKYSRFTYVQVTRRWEWSSTVRNEIWRRIREMRALYFWLGIIRRVFWCLLLKKNWGSVCLWVGRGRATACWSQKMRCIETRESGSLFLWK